MGEHIEKLDSDCQEPVAPDRWVDEYGDMLFRYAFSRLRNRESAEEVVQETLLSAFRAFDSFEGRSSTRTWLFSILKNRLIDHVRKISRDSEHVDSGSDESEVMSKAFNASGIWSVYVPDWAGEPDRALENKEFIIALKGCLDKLPERSKQAFTLKFLEELDAEEICKALGVSSSNYWVIIYRARMALRECIENSWIKSGK